MRLALFLVPTAFGLLSAGCEPQTPTAPEVRLSTAARRAAAVSRILPFSATLEGVGAEPADASRCAPLLTIGLQSAGTGTYLGRFSGVHSHCLDPNSPLAFTDGLVTFTAADGDQLMATYAGALTPTDQPGVFALDNVVTIIGGTGRFTSATGEARAVGTLDLTRSEAPFSLVLEGVLTLES